MSNIVENYLWVEKYRPKELSDMVLPESYRKPFEQFISDKEIPSLMLIGAPGSGKTTLARILIDKISDDESDVLSINGSSMTGVDVIRDLVEEFLKVPPYGDCKHKIVFIDEFDYMSHNAQASLRGIIEQYSANGRFIFTANYKHKILKELFSRVSTFEFKRLPKNFVEDFCASVLTRENIGYDATFLSKSVSTYYPDIRKILNHLQGLVSNGVINSDQTSLIVNEKRIIALFVNITMVSKIGKSNSTQAAINEIQKILSENDVDYNSIYEEAYYSETVPIWAKVVINEYANKHRDCLIPALNLVACMYQIYKAGLEIFEVKISK